MRRSARLRRPRSRRWAAMCESFRRGGVPARHRAPNRGPRTTTPWVEMSSPGARRVLRLGMRSREEATTVGKDAAVIIERLAGRLDEATAAVRPYLVAEIEELKGDAHNCRW